jgi:tripartite-type tricarboxylate transporter receptor subunit TctC
MISTGATMAQHKQNTGQISTNIDPKRDSKRYFGQRRAIGVDNRASGGGAITADLADKAPPDVYTVFMAYTLHTVNATLVPKLPYRTVDNFTPITQITDAALILVANPATPVYNLREFLDWSKTFKGALNFGSAGTPAAGGSEALQ